MTDVDNNGDIGDFLSFLASDIQENPEYLNTINPDLLHCMQCLITNVHVDMDQVLPDDEDDDEDEDESPVSNKAKRR